MSLRAVRNTHGRTLGLDAEALAGKPYARFYEPNMAPLSAEAREAITVGPVAPPLLPGLAEAHRLIDPRAQGLENGFSLQADGSLHVAIRTDLPGVSPEMIDWWFGWHSAEPERYKLWHPRAHVHAEWRSPDPPGLSLSGRARYVGRVSCVDEYVGSELGRYAIRFVPPAELGLTSTALDDPDRETAVCARVGLGDLPIDFGTLAHHVRRTAHGSEMRSRFWIGGPYASTRAGGALGAVVVAVARRFERPTAGDAAALLVHCAQEMAHLGRFLPTLHAELHATP